MTSILYHWILSEDGQKLANQLGYVSVMEVD
jgi:ABC-type phosphate transport system substrate-binding protein